MGKKELLKAMGSVRESLKKEDSLELRLLANDSIKKAALSNDKAMASVSLVAYSLHKILSKEHFVKSKKWKQRKKAILSCLDRALASLEKGKMKAFHKCMGSIAAEVQKMDRSFGRYVQSLFDKARVKYAADAYFFGLSLSQASSLTRADRKAVQEYVGFTKLHDKDAAAEGIGKRLRAFRKAMGE